MRESLAQQTRVASSCSDLTLAVLIASYRRPQDLRRCLESLATQLPVPHEVIVVARTEDAATLEVLEVAKQEGLPVQVVQVSVPGTVVARNAGLDKLSSDVVVMLDDDTVVLPDFTAKVLAHFQQDPALGGLGGRDRCYGAAGFDDQQAEEVGKIRWYGKIVGNHHIGFGETREVDLLKGANMSYRAKAVRELRFDSRLRGQGAQPSEDLCFSIAVKAHGWKLAYDPAVMVHHFASQRSEERQYSGVKKTTDYPGFCDHAYNQVIALSIALPWWKLGAFLVWSTLIGTGVFPGLIQAVRYTPTLGSHSWRRFAVAQKGKLAACRDLLLPN